MYMLLSILSVGDDMHFYGLVQLYRNTCNSIAFFTINITNLNEIKDLNHFGDHLDMEMKEYFHRGIA